MVFQNFACHGVSFRMTRIERLELAAKRDLKGDKNGREDNIQIPRIGMQSIFKSYRRPNKNASETDS